MMMLQLAPLSSESSSPPFEVKVQTPTQEEAEALGIREWSQQARRKGIFVEAMTAGDSASTTTTITRYVLEGEGQLTVVSGDYDNDNDNNKPVSVKLSPGTLVEVTATGTGGGGSDVQLNWDITSNEMIILTPGFEEMGLFIGVLVGLVGLVGALVTVS